MSDKYDNWERLVAAVLKRVQFLELCRTPSICSESSDFSSTSFRLSDMSMLEKKEESVQPPVPKLILVGIRLNDAFKSSTTQELENGRFGTSILIELLQDVQLSDHEFLAKGTQLVMNHLVNENATEEDIKQKMMVLGNCRHENVASPRAYYFSDKPNGQFILNDYHSQGSLSDMLHGFTDSQSWESRVKVAIGAARGIAHIHRQCGGKMAHGNIKSSNIFLNSQHYGCVSDFGFKNASQEDDVYSFGIVLLELLTGKSPMDIAAWVRSDKRISNLFGQGFRGMIVDEKDRLEMVLETEIQGGNSATSLKGLRPFLQSVVVEKIEMLQVAMRCLFMFPKDRPKMHAVELMLEKIEGYQSADVVPKYGEWNENDPRSAEDYTHIFNRVREERNTGTRRANDTRKDPSLWERKAQQNNSNSPDEKKQVWSRIFGFGR